jgi:hypothetical protein
MSNEEKKYILIDTKNESVLATSRLYFYKNPRLYITFLFLLGMVLFTIPLLLTINLVKLDINSNNVGGFSYSMLPVTIALLISILYMCSLILNKIYLLLFTSR